MLIILSVAFVDKLQLDDPVGAIAVHLICGYEETWLLVFLERKPELINSLFKDLAFSSLAVFA
ncbi:hypothetical protein ABW636_02700 [Aquimarina sp. 2201CG1-2-11]|uniref:hypothetical protein n=1 Tax=Aquimarina discodermiae TaxID=3231043 RepID=UPI003462E7EC